jgi:hypothetical protein
VSSSVAGATQAVPFWSTQRIWAAAHNGFLGSVPPALMPILIGGSLREFSYLWRRWPIREGCAAFLLAEDGWQSLHYARRTVLRRPHARPPSFSLGFRFCSRCLA